MCSQHAAIAVITHNNYLLLMKEMKKETILKLFVGTSSLKIHVHVHVVRTKAPMPHKNVHCIN